MDGDKLDTLVESCIRTEDAVKHLVDASSDHERRLRYIERVLSYGSGVGFAVYLLITKWPA